MIYWRLCCYLRDSYESLFQIKLFISLVAFFSVLFALLGGYYYVDVGKQLYQEMSTRAKIQAEEIALIPTLRNEVEQKDIPQSMILCKK
jgi:two-component system cit operon sensor histidine kinase CitA